MPRLCLVLLGLACSALAERGEHNLGIEREALELSSRGHMVGQRRKSRRHGGPCYSNNGGQLTPSEPTTTTLPLCDDDDDDTAAPAPTPAETRGPELSPAPLPIEQPAPTPAEPQQAPTPAEQPSPAPAPAPLPPPPPIAGGDYKLMSYNVYFRNKRYWDIAGVIGKAVNPDMVNMQEATGNMAPEIVKKLNALGGGEWALANPWAHDHYWCGLTAYRSDRWDMLWHKELGVEQERDHRGLCGALLKRKEDGVKVCIFGTHPIWRAKNAPGNEKWRGQEKWAIDVIQKGAEMMKECTDQGGTAAFLCDCNTDEHEPVRSALQASTGLPWKIAGTDRYDKIFIQSNDDPAKASIPHNFASVNPRNRQKRYCQEGCKEPTWGYSDHPPVYVSVTPK